MKKIITLLLTYLALNTIILAADVKIIWKDPNPVEVGIIKYRVYRVTNIGSTNWVRLGETTNRFYNLTLTNEYTKFKVVGVTKWTEGVSNTNSEPELRLVIPMAVEASVTNWIR